MNKLDSYFKQNFNEYPLNIDIDEIPDLKLFQKLKNKLDLNKVLDLFVEDLSKNPVDLLPYLYYLKSFIAIFGLQFVFLLIKTPNFLKNLQINSNAQSENKAIPTVFTEILLMIAEKTKELRASDYDLNEIKNLSQIKLVPLKPQTKTPKYSANSEFDKIYSESIIFHREVQSFLKQKGETKKRSLEYIMRLDEFNSRIVALPSNISKSESALNREITRTNKNLIEELKKIQEPVVNIQKKDPLAKRTFFRFMESLPLENMEIEYKNYYFPFSMDQVNKLENCICAFLNTNGGRIFLGVKDDGNKVVGLKLNTQAKREEVMEQLTYIMESLTPKLKSDRWKIYFLPIKNEFGQDKGSFYVVKIMIISRGDEKFLYSTKENKCFKRRDGKVKMMTVEEMKVELNKRRENPIVAENNDDFNDPEPQEKFVEYYDDYEDTNIWSNRFNNNYGYLYEKVYVPKPGQNLINNNINNNINKNMNIMNNMEFSKNNSKGQEENFKFENPVPKKTNDIKKLNLKVLRFKISGEPNKTFFSEVVLFVKKMVVDVFELKVLKIIDNFENSLFFVEIENEFSEKKEEIFDLISNAFYANYEKHRNMNLTIEIAEIAEFEKYKSQAQPQIPENAIKIDKRQSQKNKSLNLKVVCFKLLGESVNKTLFLDIVLFVKKMMNEFEVVKMINRLEKSLVFVELKEEIVFKEEQLFERINNAFCEDYEKKHNIHLWVGFAEKKKFDKYLNMILIK